MFLITKDASEIIVPETMTALSEVYTTYAEKRTQLAADAIKELKEKVANKESKNTNMEYPSPPPLATEAI